MLPFIVGRSIIRKNEGKEGGGGICPWRSIRRHIPHSMFYVLFLLWISLRTPIHAYEYVDMCVNTVMFAWLLGWYEQTTQANFHKLRLYIRIAFVCYLREAYCVCTHNVWHSLTYNRILTSSMMVVWLCYGSIGAILIITTDHIIVIYATLTMWWIRYSRTYTAYIAMDFLFFFITNT